MTVIVLLLLVCAVPTSLSKLADLNLSVEGAREQDTRASKTTQGNIIQKPLPYDREFDGRKQTPVDRSDEDINYTYPDQVQLVPNIPVNPQSPKYSLVPVRRPATTNPFPTDAHQQVGDFKSRIPPDFAEEIAKIRESNLGRLPDFNSGPQPFDEADEEDEVDEEDEFTEHDGDHNYFTNDFDPQPQYKHVVRAVPSPRFPVSNHIPSSGLNIMVKHRPEHTNPLVVTQFPSFDPNDGLRYENNQSPGEYRQIPTNLKHDHPGHSPFCNENVALRHYGPPQPVPSFRQFNHGPYVVHPRPPVARTKRPRTYIRYPRNYRTYYHHPAANNRVKVMTQSFVYHPTEYYRDLRNPVMMSSVPQLRNANSPPTKRKKKKKKSKSKNKGIKGECKPKKIIKEIHFHHYDPQLSAQLAPLEGINLKDGEDYENDIKVITKETEIEDDDKKKPNDYDDQYNQDVQKEMNGQSKGRGQRLTQPDYYGDAYNNQFSETGSVEYIDYNVQTDSSSSTLMGSNNANTAEDFTQNKRAFRIQDTPTSLRVPSNATGPSRSPTKISLDVGPYKTPETHKYHYTTPGKQSRH